MKANTGNANNATVTTDATLLSLSALNPLSLWHHPKLPHQIIAWSLVLCTGLAYELPGRPLLAAKVPCTTMVRGDVGENVRALQQTLVNNGYAVGTVDGVFGEMTQISIINFQRKNNLDTDGEVGAATCAALIKLNNSELIAASTPGTASTNTTSSSTTGTGNTPSATASAPKILKRGDEGNEVTLLQNALRSRGFSNQSVNGKYDLETENTVKRLQLLEGLPITGEFDGVTRARLDAFLREDAARNGTNPTATTQPATTPTQIYNPNPPSRTTPSSPTAQTSPMPSSSTNTQLRDYTVVVPFDGEDMIRAVRGVVPGATVGENRLGRFVNAGSYANRFEAESLSNQLRSRGFDARVVKR